MWAWYQSLPRFEKTAVFVFLLPVGLQLSSIGVKANGVEIATSASSSLVTAIGDEKDSLWAN